MSTEGGEVGRGRLYLRQGAISHLSLMTIDPWVKFGRVAGKGNLVKFSDQSSRKHNMRGSRGRGGN